MSQAVLIIAIVTAVLLATALLVKAVLRRLVGHLGQSVEEMLQAVTLAPPIRIHLEPVDPAPWREPANVEQTIARLRALGYEDAGPFRIRETDLVLHGMASTCSAAFAAVLEHPGGAIAVELATPYSNGALYTTSTCPDTSLPRPEDMVLRHAPKGRDPAQLHEEHLAHRPEGPFEFTRPQDFQTAFERAYARAMEHIASVGLSDDHVRAIAATAGIEVSDAVVQRTKRAFQMQAEIELLETLRHRFLDQSGLTASQWESMRDEVVFVHDRMTEDHIIGAYAEALDEAGDDPESLELAAESIARSAPPRDAFARLNQTLPEARAFQRIGEVDGPIRADVYRQRAA